MVIFEENFRCHGVPRVGGERPLIGSPSAIFSTWFEPKPSHHFSNTHKASERPTQTFIRLFAPLSFAAPRFFFFILRSFQSFARKLGSELIAPCFTEN